MEYLQAPVLRTNRFSTPVMSLTLAMVPGAGVGPPLGFQAFQVRFACKPSDWKCSGVFNCHRIGVNITVLQGLGQFLMMNLYSPLQCPVQNDNSDPCRDTLTKTNLRLEIERMTRVSVSYGVSFFFFFQIPVLFTAREGGPGTTGGHISKNRLARDSQVKLQEFNRFVPTAPSSPGTWRKECAGGFNYHGEREPRSFWVNLLWSHPSMPF